jgi:aspartyl-tRNA(Asn)/glutamyl-tRNA(Gln) amidotransferase subunit A
VVEVGLPHLGAIATAHMVTIASEMATARATHRERHAPEIRLNLALAGRLRATDYAQAQRVRAQAYEIFMAALTEADVLLTPATGCVAPPIPQQPENDLELLDRIMRFARPANLTGLPAISFPAGYDADGLPIGMQAIAGPWREALLLELSRVAEAAVPRQLPALYRSPL